jgi:anti-anti-sigma regulatory factor
MKVTISFLGQVGLVSLSGKLEIEKMPDLRKIFLDQIKSHKIIICFREIGFVGSYGITVLFQLIQEMKSINPEGVKISGLSRDFSFLMDSMGYQFEKYPTIESALRAYQELPSKSA